MLSREVKKILKNNLPEMLHLFIAGTEPMNGG